MTTKQNYLTLLVKLRSTLMMQRSVKGQDVYIQTHLPLRFWHKMYAIQMLYPIICWPGENYDFSFFWAGLFTVLILLGWQYFLLKATRNSNVSFMKWWRVCFEKWVYKQKPKQTKNTTKNNMRSKCLPRLQKFRLSSTLYFVLWERDHSLHIALCASQISQMHMVANPI